MEWKNVNLIDVIVFVKDIFKRNNVPYVISFNDKNEIVVDSRCDKQINIDLNKNKEIEDFFKPFLTDLMIVKKQKYPKSVFYKKDGEIIFELYQYPENKEIRFFYVDHDKIWKVFHDKFGLNYDDTQSFIKTVVEDTLKLGSITPCYVYKIR